MERENDDGGERKAPAFSAVIVVVELLWRGTRGLWRWCSQRADFERRGGREGEGEKGRSSRRFLAEGVGKESE